MTKKKLASESKAFLPFISFNGRCYDSSPTASIRGEKPRGLSSQDGEEGRNSHIITSLSVTTNLTCWKEGEENQMLGEQISCQVLSIICPRTQNKQLTGIRKRTFEHAIPVKLGKAPKQDHRGVGHACNLRTQMMEAGGSWDEDQLG